MNSLQSVINIVSEQSGSDIESETRIDSLGLDSLDFVEIAMEVEDDLKVKLEADHVLKCTTISDLAQLIDSTPPVVRGWFFWKKRAISSVG